MIGDNPSTDILFGKHAGVDQCLVLTGVVRSVEELQGKFLAESESYRPTWVMNMLGDL